MFWLCYCHAIVCEVWRVPGLWVLRQGNLAYKCFIILNTTWFHYLLEESQMVRKELLTWIYILIQVKSKQIRAHFIAVYLQCVLCGIMEPWGLTHLIPSSSVVWRRASSKGKLWNMWANHFLLLFFPFYSQLPGSSEGDFHSPGADLSSAVCDSLPTSEPAQCHPEGQFNQVYLSGKWYVYGVEPTYEWLDWTFEAIRFLFLLTYPFCFSCNMALFSMTSLVCNTNTCNTVNEDSLENYM